MTQGTDSDAMSLLAMSQDTSASSVSGTSDVQEPPQKKPRNTMLRGWELPPGQLLNPMGKSGVGVISVEQLWTVLAKGGDKTEYFSNFHSHKPARRLIGISQLSEVMELTCKQIIEDPALNCIIEAKLMKEIREEAKRMLPTFTALNQKGTRRSEMTKTKNVAYYQQDPSRPSAEVLKTHAECLHTFLTNKSSKLRMFIAAMSCGGIFYVAQCHEKTARGFVQHGGGDLQAMKDAVVAGTTDISGPDETAGLLGGA